MIEAQKAKKLMMVHQFRKNASMNQLKYFDIPLEYRFQNSKCIVYRKKNWEKYQSLKTFICVPGTRFIYNNIVNFDTAYPLLLDSLGEDYQIIIALHPLAPEHTFPTPIKGLIESIPELIQNYSFYKIDASKTVLAGYSSGGSMNVTLSIELAKKGIYFKATMMISPPLDYSGLLKKDPQLSKLWQSYESKDHPKLNTEFINFMNYYYSNSQEDLTDPWYSPIYASKQQLQKLRNPYFVYGQYDFMRRTIQHFKKQLDDVGVKNESIIIKDHGHFILFLAKNSTSDRKQIDEQQKTHKMMAIKMIASAIRQILE